MHVTLRPVNIVDQQLLLAWRSDREVMQYLPSADPAPTWSKQLNWWVSRPKTRHDHMVQAVDGEFSRPVGIAHWDEATGEVGILIGEKSSWGKGYGRTALQMLLASLPKGREVWVVIHPGNQRSIRLFLRAGFMRTEEPGRNGQLTYRWRHE